GPLPNLSGLFNDFRGISVIISKYDFFSDQYDMGSRYFAQTHTNKPSTSSPI
ncbi:hypothetical protein ISN45_Aa04g015770, partial [Arabidopsis thaliana x Arabidopsis arenosa]